MEAGILTVISAHLNGPFWDRGITNIFVIYKELIICEPFQHYS